jgi:voltage-gated sodium channel
MATIMAHRGAATGNRSAMPAPGRNRLAAIVDAPWFTSTILAVIVVNAIALGLETYPGIDDRWGDALFLLNEVCLAIFVVELALRIASYLPRPLGFFRDGWNVFDFVVIGAAFVPGVRESATLLRIVRLARVFRVVRFLPDVRVLLAGVYRSIPPLFSIGLLTAMLLFFYGMIGWSLFHDELPKDWGTIGRAMLTLFVMLTLENFPTYMDAGMEVHPWSWVYFVSFVLIAAFIVINVLIGIVLNSMEEAREAERRQAVRDRLGVEGRPSELVDVEAHAPVVERIALLRTALDELETELSTGGATPAEPEGSASRRPRPGEA